MIRPDPDPDPDRVARLVRPSVRRSVGPLINITSKVNNENCCLNNTRAQRFNERRALHCGAAEFIEAVVNIRGPFKRNQTERGK